MLDCLLACVGKTSWSGSPSLKIAKTGNAGVLPDHTIGETSFGQPMERRPVCGYPNRCDFSYFRFRISRVKRIVHTPGFFSCFVWLRRICRLSRREDTIQNGFTEGVFPGIFCCFVLSAVLLSTHWRLRICSVRDFLDYQRCRTGRLDRLSGLLTIRLGRVVGPLVVVYAGHGDRKGLELSIHTRAWSAVSQLQCTACFPIPPPPK